MELTCINQGQPRMDLINTTIKTTSVSDGRCRRRKWATYMQLAVRGLDVVDTRYGIKWAWLAGRGRCTESRPELETVNK